MLSSARGLLALIAATLALAAGCGGNDDGGSSADEWASSVCTAIGSWMDSVNAVADSIKADPTQQGVEEAVGDLTNSTENLVEDLKGLGRPETEAGQQAQESVDELTNELDQSVTAMESAVEDASGASGFLNAVSVVSGNLVTMSQNVSSTLASIEQLEGGDELQQAFEQSDACADLRSSGS